MSFQSKGMFARFSSWAWLIASLTPDSVEAPPTYRERMVVHCECALLAHLHDESKIRPIIPYVGVSNFFLPAMPIVLPVLQRRHRGCHSHSRDPWPARSVANSLSAPLGCGGGSENSGDVAPETAGEAGCGGRAVSCRYRLRALLLPREMRWFVDRVRLLLYRVIAPN